MEHPDHKPTQAAVTSGGSRASRVRVPNSRAGHQGQTMGNYPPRYPRQGMGELPRNVRLPRRELYNREAVEQGPPGVLEEIPGAPQPQPPEPPMLPSIADVRGQNQGVLDSNSIPYGLPQTGYVVQSTYDARPINGNDFQFLDFTALSLVADPPVTRGEVKFIVPPGRVAVLRRINWTSPGAVGLPGFDEVSTIEQLSPVFIQFAISGSVQTTYERIFAQEGSREVYAIAGENESIEFRVILNPEFSGVLPPSTVLGYFVEFYGNLIDTRGRERQYETANQYISGVLR